MPLKFINAGGSLTLSAVLLAALWSFRSLRARHIRKASAAAGQKHAGAQACPRYAFEITVEALALLVELQAVPHYVLDVRSAADAAAAPLPAWLSCHLHIPESQLTAALLPPHTAWRTAVAAAAAAAAADVPPPSRQHLLILLCHDEQQQQAAASRVAAAGYDRVAILAGSCSRLSSQQQQQQQQQQRHQGESPAVAAAALSCLHRDALALLVDLAPLPDEAYQLSTTAPQQQQQQQQQQVPNSAADSTTEAAAGSDVRAAAAATGHQGLGLPDQRVLVLDVRRHDERTLYGAIPGALHLPVDELPSALLLPAGQFRRHYHFDPPAKHEVLVMQSRGNSRARFAAQLAHDAGFQHVFVYVDGVHNWRLSLAVQAYPSYQTWQPPPDPEPFVPSQIDGPVGAAELQRLGLLNLLLMQHTDVMQ